MILVASLLTVLVITSTEGARIKGGPRIVQEPAVIQEVSEPHLHVAKGGRGGALHHTALLRDPISQDPVVVEQVQSIGDPSGIQSSSFGADSAQFTLSDAQIPFGQRRLYRSGLSQVPFGLSGLDYYSFPNSLLTQRRVLRRKTVSSDNLSGLRPVGFSSGRKGGIIAVGPSIAQFSAEKTSPFGARRAIYRTGISPVPFGLMGLDYYSYPAQLLTQRRLSDDVFGQRHILSGASAFTAGDAQIRGPALEPVGQEKVTVVETSPSLVGGLGDGFGQRQVTTTTVTKSADPVSAALGQGFGQRQVTTVTKSAGGGLRGLRGGQIILSGAQGIGGLRRVKTRPVVRTSPAQSVQLVLDDNSGLGAPIGGFGQRQLTVSGGGIAPVAAISQVPIAQARVIEKQVVQAPVAQAPIAQARFIEKQVVQAPVVQAPIAQARVIEKQVVQAPIAPAPIRRRVVSRGPGEVFLTQVSRPRVAPQRVTTITRQAPAVVAPVAVPIGQQRVSVVEEGFGGSSVRGPLGPGSIQFTLGDSQLIGGPIVAQRPVIAAARPQVLSQVRTDADFGGRQIFGRRIPQMVYVDGGSRFPGIDIIGGSRVGDPRYGYAQLPISTQRFASLGRLSQARVPVQSFIDAGPTLVAPAPAPLLRTKSTLRKAAPLLSAGGLSGPGNIQFTLGDLALQGPQVVAAAPVRKTTIAQAAAPLVFSAVGRSAPTKVVTQEQVIGPAGDPQIRTTVTKTEPSPALLTTSKIGRPAIANPFGLKTVGQGAPSKVVTQEEVIGPAGGRQVITTVAEKSGPSKIGGPVVGGLGLSAVGRAPVSKVVTQEEVIGPAGDAQVITTVSKQAGPSKIGGPVIASPLGFAGVGQSTSSKTVTQEEVIGPAGDRAVVTTVTKQAGPSKIGGPVVASPLGFAGVGQSGSSKTVVQEEVIGPAGDRAVVTTVTKQAGPSKIGGPVVASPLGFAGVGQSGSSKTVVQEEVVGPAGDRAVVTTVTKQAGPSKIGGPAVASPFGFAGVGQSTSSKTITQEEVIGPAGDRAVVTTVSKQAGPSKIGGQAVASPFGFAGVGQSASSKTVTQEEVIGPAGDRAVVTTVTKQAGPSKIGGPAIGGGLGLAAVGRAPISKVVTQEEVVGPAGDTQVLTTVTKTAAGPSKIGGLAAGGPLGFASVGHSAPSQVVTQEEVIGPAGDAQVVTTVTKQAGASKIGGPAISSPFGFAGVAQSASSKTVTEEEVIGPAGERAVVTTVTENAGPSKIGGPVIGGAFSAVGRAPVSKVVTQEEIVGPAGDAQLLTTVTKSVQDPSPIVQQEEVLSPISSLSTISQLSQEIAQDPIEASLSQGALEDSAILSSGPSLLQPFSQSVQSVVDPIGSGQSQLSVDDVIAQSPFSGAGGTVTKITEVSQAPVGISSGSFSGIAQESIADRVVQESISSDIGGLSFAPRVSFLSQYPYDIRDPGLLRSVLTRPVV
ncbi:Polysialoglycoprotein, partial [Stegodyphus mimosarum]